MLVVVRQRGRAHLVVVHAAVTPRTRVGTGSGSGAGWMREAGRAGCGKRGDGVHPPPRIVSQVEEGLGLVALALAFVFVFVLHFSLVDLSLSINGLG